MSNSFKRSFLLAIFAVLTSALFAQKDEVPKGWHLLDKQTTGFYGISIDKAYDFVKAKKLKFCSNSQHKSSGKFLNGVLGTLYKEMFPEGEKESNANL